MLCFYVLCRLSCSNVITQVPYEVCRDKAMRCSITDEWAQSGCIRIWSCAMSHWRETDLWLCTNVCCDADWGHRREASQHSMRGISMIFSEVRACQLQEKLLFSPHRIEQVSALRSIHESHVSPRLISLPCALNFSSQTLRSHRLHIAPSVCAVPWLRTNAQPLCVEPHHGNRESTLLIRHRILGDALIDITTVIPRQFLRAVLEIGTLATARTL